VASVVLLYKAGTTDIVDPKAIKMIFATAWDFTFISITY